MLAMPYGSKAHDDCTLGILLMDTITCTCHALAEARQKSLDVPSHQLMAWSPGGNLLTLQSTSSMHLLALYGSTGDLLQTVALPSVAGIVSLASIHKPVPQQAWSAGSRYCILYGECMRTRRCWLCDFGTSTLHSIDLPTITRHWPCPAWDPSSERLLLCSQSHDVALRQRDGRCSLQTLSHTAQGGAVWTPLGIAICSQDTLNVYAAPPGAYSLQLLRILALQPGCTFYQPAPCLDSLEAVLAASWDGATLAVLVAREDAAGVTAALALAFVSWDAGIVQVIQLGQWSLSDTFHTHLTWAPDGQAICLSDMPEEPWEMVFRFGIDCA